MTVSSSEYAGAQQHNRTSGALPVFHSLWGVPGGMTTQLPAATAASSPSKLIRPVPATK